MSVGDEAATAIEALRCLVFADDGQLNQFDAFTRMGKNRVDERRGDSSATRAGANVHAPQEALVSSPRSVLRAVAGHAQKIGSAEGSEDIRLGQNLFELRQRLRALVLEGAAESLGGLLKRFQPDLPELQGVGWRQAADLGRLCHGPNSMNRL